MGQVRAYNIPLKRKVRALYSIARPIRGHDCRCTSMSVYGEVVDPDSKLTP
jgi:hypothetical protein